MSHIRLTIQLPYSYHLPTGRKNKQTENLSAPLEKKRLWTCSTKNGFLHFQNPGIQSPESIPVPDRTVDFRTSLQVLFFVKRLFMAKNRF